MFSDINISSAIISSIVAMGSIVASASSSSITAGESESTYHPFFSSVNRLDFRNAFRDSKGMSLDMGGDGYIIFLRISSIINNATNHHTTYPKTNLFMGGGVRR